MIAAPYAVGVIYQTYGNVTGYNYVFGMLTAVFAVVAVAVLLLGIETKGKSLDATGGKVKCLWYSYF